MAGQSSKSRRKARGKRSRKDRENAGSKEPRAKNKNTLKALRLTLGSARRISLRGVLPEYICPPDGFLLCGIVRRSARLSPLERRTPGATSYPRRAGASIGA